MCWVAACKESRIEHQCLLRHLAALRHTRALHRHLYGVAASDSADDMNLVR